VILTHEYPSLLANSLREHGIHASWIKYDPDEGARLARVAKRDVDPCVKRYMAGTWSRLDREKGHTLRTDDEEVIVALARREQSPEVWAAVQPSATYTADRHAMAAG